MGKLDNLITVITGGGSGIGLCASELFANEGATVLIIDVDEALGKKAELKINSRGKKAKFFQADISDFQKVKAVFSQIEKEFDGIDVLYNNASVFWGENDAPLDIINIDIFERIIKINLFGLVYCSKCAIPLLKKHGGGSIINTASSAAIIGVPKCDSYTASKGGTVSLTRSMAVEFGPYNIRTNCIAPAAILTPMVVESNLNDSDFKEEVFLTQGTPLRRWGKPEEIASIALFLASKDSSYLNGAILVADGGITVT